MKKTIIGSLLATAVVAASAANFVSVDVETVKDSVTGAKSQAQYVRVGRDVGNLNLGLQVRTATFKAGGMVNSVEGTVGTSLLGVNMFTGLGYDNGFNGGRSFQYGLVGASTGMKLGPVYSYAGVKTRLNWDSANPKQTVAFAGISHNLTKNVSVNLGVGRSYQDIKESSYGLGIRVGF